MRVTKIIRPFALGDTAALGSGGGIIDSTGQDGQFPGSGQVPTSTGSNGWAWGSNVQRIFSNTSNALLGPFVNFQNGSGIAFSVASNTLTIAATGGAVASGGGGFEQIGMVNVASNAANTTNLSVTITAPTNGNTLVVLVKSDARDQTGISCTNVSFTSRYNNSGNSQYVRVYTGAVSASAGTTVTITHGSSNYCEAVVMEFTAAFANAGNSSFTSQGSGTITQGIGYWNALYTTVVGRYVFVITGESNGTTAMRAAMTSTHICLNTGGTGSFAYGPSPGGAVSVGTYTATSGTYNRCIAAVELYA